MSITTDKLVKEGWMLGDIEWVPGDVYQDKNGKYHLGSLCFVRWRDGTESMLGDGIDYDPNDFDGLYLPDENVLCKKEEQALLL